MGNSQFTGWKFSFMMTPRKQKFSFPYFAGMCAWVKKLTLKMDMNLNIYDKSQIQVFTGMFPRDYIYQDLTHFNLWLFEKSPRNRNQEFWKEFTDFLQNILKNSPNLREVNVKYLNYKGHKLPICTVMEDIFSNSVGISKLRSIDFQEVSLEKIDLAKWSTLNLKLRKLAIALSSLSSDLNDRLAKFLETQTGTLEQLTLTLNQNRYHSIRSAATFTFPRMEKVEQLRVTSTYKANLTLVTFPGIDYARLFPSLKKLDLKVNGIDWQNFLGNTLLAPTNTVEELIFHKTLDRGFYGTTFPNPIPVVFAARVFPSLRKLEIPAHRLLTEVVYENLPNLEVLSLIGDIVLLDHLITGLWLQVCNTFEGVLTDTWIKKLETAEWRSMVCLQKLQTLKLSNKRYDLICFSRLSFHVFKQMRSLKCLDLNGWAGRQRNRRYEHEERERQFLADLQEKFVVL